MPSPPTTDLPRPTSWSELEDICADVLKRIWEDPYIVRNGRLGQSQNGVDCYGLPKHLGGANGKKFGGAQCKKMDDLTFDAVLGEVEKAKGFQPLLAEYLVMTTASRNAKIQESVRTQIWPFDRVHVLFWDDICLELSGHDDLLQKHFPGWIKRTTTEEHVLNMVLSSDPDGYKYDDRIGEFFHKSDVSLRIVFERSDGSRRGFYEPWLDKFTKPYGTRQPVYIYYGQTRVKEVICVSVDGGRYIIPIPRSATDLTLSQFDYHVGCILNHPCYGSDFSVGLQRAGITVRS